MLRGALKHCSVFRHLCRALFVTSALVILVSIYVISQLLHQYSLGTFYSIQFLRSSFDTPTSSPEIGTDESYMITTNLGELHSFYSVQNLSCSALFDSEVEAARASEGLVKILTESWNKVTDEFYATAAKDCDGFKKSRGYIMSSLTQEEAQFPLAYSILVYKDLEMVERLLRMIYRPQNYYCIHVDKKASVPFFQSLSTVVACFPNVFICSRRFDVQWGQFSVLEPEIVCMRDLWRYKRWTYFINLTGQEFPLKTNLELVRILKAYNGANDVTGSIERADKSRWSNVKSPKNGIVPHKGSVHVMVNRNFVDYILHNETAQEFLNWTKKTYVPDETFFSTLNHNPHLGISGSYTGEKETFQPFSQRRYKMWDDMPCSGKLVRNICILSTGDLPRLGRSTYLFANKFFLDQDRVVIGCLEEKLFNDTRDEFLGVKEFNSSFYAELDFAKNHLP